MTGKEILTNGNVWKWISSLLATALLAIAGTVYTVKPDEEQISRIARQAVREVASEMMSEVFTEISTEHGLYVIEGRPRIERLENRLSKLEAQQSEILSQQGELLTILRRIDGRLEEK